MPYTNEQKQELRRIARLDGICVACLSSKAEDGMKMCSTCLSKAKTRGNERRQRAIILGLCSMCVKEKPEPGKKSCASCLVRLRDKNKQFRLSKKGCQGICRKCLKTPVSAGICDKCRVHRIGTRRRKNIKLKLEAFNYYGGPYCACCKEDIVSFLTIDHINNDGAEHRKKDKVAGRKLYKWLKQNNYPAGFQVMCYNCNLGRDKCDGKICPHKRHQEFLDGAGI